MMTRKLLQRAKWLLVDAYDRVTDREYPDVMPTLSGRPQKSAAQVAADFHRTRGQQRHFDLSVPVRARVRN
ncbi:hypothetical protein [Kineococcus halophytocola]